MQEGHTPGPWHQHTNEFWRDAGYIKTEDGTTVAHAKLLEADARLIAAAPDLLAALQEIQAIVIERHPDGRPRAWLGGTGPAERIDAIARSAISKAQSLSPKEG